MDKLNNERLQIEWLVVNALRENLSMLDERTNVTYNRAIEFAQNNFTDLFGGKDSILGQKEFIDIVYEKYLEEAKARSIDENKQISAEELIKIRIEHIEKLVKNPLNKETKLKQLNREKAKLVRLLREHSPMFLSYSEDEALRNDYDGKRLNLEYVKQIAGKYKIFRTRSGDPFVIRFLHPGKAEAATGVDLIYEYHYDGMVRIIAVQYKIWEDGILYFSQVKNLAPQLNTATACFCKKGYCEASSKIASSNTYRLPYCVPFLRPTDKLQNPDNYITSGWHIPICQLPDRLDISKDGNKILRLDKILDVALNAPEFERLFDKGLLGSRWFTIKELESFYKENKVLEPNDQSIIILSQKF
ncbi:MAG: hypothetical protein K0R26_579 [Bacteroidota bacterium]|jgi:hypothetical protein|nr:hypothetical protein [Bacteroidota bacterium]